MLISITGKETFNPANWHQQFKVGLGLDLSSGTQVVLQAHTGNGKPPAAGEMQQAINVLTSRVNGTGNSGAQVQQQGSDMINVSVPGKGSQDVINLVSTTAQLRFRQVLLFEPYGATAPSQSSTPTPKPSASANASSTPSASSTPHATATPTGTAT